MTVRGAVERLLREIWRGREAPPLLRMAGLALRPASWLYGGGVALRTRILAPAEHAGVPVVSVGNLAVGGTGKTPVAAWMASQLESWGARPAVLLRGYGTDEAALHRRLLGDHRVEVHHHRVRAARAAVEKGAGTLVLDDGFQHRRLHRDMDVVLLAAEDPFPGPLLPAGPYREPPAALARADVVVVTRRTADPGAALRRLEAARRYLAPGTVTARLAFRCAGWRDLEGRPVDAPSGPVVALAGIARPRAFLGGLHAEGIRVARLLAPGDHHAYHRRDVERIARIVAGRTLVTTPKDGVRLEGWVQRLGDVRVRHETIQWEEGEADVLHLLRRIAGRVA